MKKILLLMLAVALTCVLWLTANHWQKQDLLQQTKVSNNENAAVTVLPSIVSFQKDAHQMAINPLNAVKHMLHREAHSLSIPVINKTLASLQCAKARNVEHNNILTIIDYSLPSSDKRLWVFDLKEQKLLFHTYVSHGIKSGALLTNAFSNKYDSKASSMGIYKTEKPYYGRDGLSLRLNGLERGFNDNALNRYIVMHGGWYVDENFIKKYGRAGRSWGCPAVPLNLTKAIINTIKENSLFVAYYPDEDWFIKSKFLNCSSLAKAQSINKSDTTSSITPIEPREAILFADLNRNNKREENEPVLVITADNYQKQFHTIAPLERMLRRQIDNAEYIALTINEFKHIVSQTDKSQLNAIYFVIPVVKMKRGYYETQMTIMHLGKITDVRLNAQPTTKNGLTHNYTVYFETKSPANIRSTNQFIRWLGL